MEEKYEMMFVTDDHAKYGKVKIIMIHPNEWEDFKRRTPLIVWKEVQRDPAA